MSRPLFPVRVLAITGLASLLVPVSLHAQCEFTETQKVLASDGSGSDWFGSKVVLDDDVALISAAGLTDTVQDQGGVYVYRHDGSAWMYEQTLTAEAPASGEGLGNDLALSGSRALVGARLSDDLGTDAGSVSSFRYQGSWSEEQELFASDGEAGDQFGDSIGLDGNLAVIGATLDDDVRSDAGAAYVFRHDGTAWVEEQKLLPRGTFPYQFGYASAIDGGTIIVGSPWEDSSQGAVYVYQHDGSQWVETHRLQGSNTTAGSAFGRTLSIDGDVMVVGAPFHNSGDGVVYVLRRNGSQWVEEAELTPSDLVSGDFFGIGPDVDGEVLVSTSLSANNGRGATYVFRYNGVAWVEVQKLVASDGMFNDWMGDSGAVSGGRVIAGAAGSDTLGPSAGAVYSFDLVDLALGVSTNIAPPGATLDLTVCGGMAGRLAGAFVVDLNGTPMFLALGFGTFDAQGEWRMGGVVPVGLSGLVVDFQGLGFWNASRADLTNRQTVTFP